MSKWEQLLIDAGKYCKEIRESHNLTQNDVSQMFGRTQATISRFESGQLDSEYLFLCYINLTKVGF